VDTRTVKILLVEDDSVYCKLVKASLNTSTCPASFIVETSGNLTEALEYLKSRSFDLVLLDLELPDSSGLETFDKIYKLHPGTPIVMLTGLEDEQASIEAIKKGASDYLFKGANTFRDILVRTILYALERKRAQDILLTSERNLRNIINKSADGIVVMDKDGTVLFVNPAAESLLGQNEGELLGKSFCFPIVASGTSEIEVVRKGRRPAIAEMRVVETNWHGKNAYLASLRDITVHKATERKMKKYRENLRSLIKEQTDDVDAEKELLSVTFSSMAEGVIVVDPEKRILLFNKVAEDLAGWEFEQVQDSPIDELFYIVNERTRETIESPIDKVLISGKTEVGTDFDVLAAMDGSERPISTVAAPICKNDGTILGIVMVFRDASRERELDRMKEDFISSISHELRTPLTSIKAYAETILDDPGMPEEVRRRFLDIIDEESNRLAALIENILEISRIESGTVRILREPIDIGGVVNRVSSALQSLADKKAIQMKIDVVDELPPLHGDESRIESVVTNLVNNAIKFSPEQGRVSVSVHQQDTQLVIRVSDTGIGIPKDSLPKIFDRFYRVYLPGKQVQGTGLGLAIVKKMVMMHDGRIEVESELGQGTTFTVFLPLAGDSIPTASSVK